MGDEYDSQTEKNKDIEQVEPFFLAFSHLIRVDLAAESDSLS